MRLSPLACILVLACAADPQEGTSPGRGHGATVTGHVYCADTNAPARLATVMLEPAAILEAAPATGPRNPKADRQVQFGALQTGLDGGYTITDVPPGTYFVVAYKAGYLSPFTRFSLDALAHASPQEREQMMKDLPRVTVQGAQPVSADVRLERGGAISGTIVFDDGTPAAGLPVRVLVREKQGGKEVWSALRASPLPWMGDMSEPHTDDQGRYRLAGLAARDYVVQVDLQLQRFEFGMTVGHEGGSSSVNDVSKLAFYSGGTARKRDARPVKVGEGDEAGDDITIPLSKLHSISGELTAAHDGHVINAGRIQLLDPEDRTELEGADVLRSDGHFYLRFVPEGDYVLHVDNASDGTYEDVPYPPGTMPATHEVFHPAHTYGKSDQPLNVHEDVAGLTIAVPEKAPAAAGASSP